MKQYQMILEDEEALYQKLLNLSHKHIYVCINMFFYPSDKVLLSRSLVGHAWSPDKLSCFITFGFILELNKSKEVDFL